MTVLFGSPKLFMAFFSLFLAQQNGFSYAIQQSDPAGKIICLVLLVLSSFSWAVMVTKFRYMQLAERHTRRFMELFRKSRNPLSVFEEGVRLEGSPVFRVYDAGCKEVMYHLLARGGGSGRADTRIMPSQMQAVTTAMEQAAGDSVLKLESRMTVLATAVSGAPFLGLLGTVWGVMETFSGIAGSSGGANLQSMAPGVSAALVTTVVGLLVAIPAMFGYNYLVNSIKATIMRLDNFAAELTSSFDRRFVDHGRGDFTPAPIAALEDPPEPKRETARPKRPVKAEKESPEFWDDEDFEDTYTPARAH